MKKNELIQATILMTLRSGMLCEIKLRTKAHIYDSIHIKFLKAGQKLLGARGWYGEDCLERGRRELWGEIELLCNVIAMVVADCIHLLNCTLKRGGCNVCEVSSKLKNNA